jgi:SAM-dependent methyltransferase
VEVGCGSGVLLAELKARGYECIGVEPDKRTADWVKQNMGLDVRPGFFPDVDLPKCELFLAFDVIEHSPDPRAFMREIARLLFPGGIAIIQSPIYRGEYEPPFRDMFDKVFDDLEHLYIFSSESIHRLAMRCGLKVVREEEWRLAHEIVVLKRMVSS